MLGSPVEGHDGKQLVVSFEVQVIKAAPLVSEEVDVIAAAPSVSKEVHVMLSRTLGRESVYFDASVSDKLG